MTVMKNNSNLNNRKMDFSCSLYIEMFYRLLCAYSFAFFLYFCIFLKTTMKNGIKYVRVHNSKYFNKRI